MTLSDERMEDLLRTANRHTTETIWIPGLAAVGTKRRGTGVAMVAAMRPKQWLKNGLVFAAPAAAGIVLHPAVLGRAVLCFIALSLVASGTYLINDARDVEADRLHPKKRLRPIAAGEISLTLAVIESCALGVAGLVVAYAAGGVHMVEIAGTYVAFSLAYSWWLKNEEIICMACVASFFVIRVLAGAVVTHAVVPHAMLLTTGFGALFMVVGKRFAEFQSLGEERGAHRQPLSVYTEPYLRAMFYMTGTATLLMYCWWTIERTKMAATPTLCFELSMIPAVIMVMRYALLVEHGQGGAPEELVFKDRQLQMLGLIATGLFVAGALTGVHP
jgi:decaprenyl-phosphate phosphoribosyltransferase